MQLLLTGQEYTEQVEHDLFVALPLSKVSMLLVRLTGEGCSLRVLECRTCGDYNPALGFTPAVGAFGVSCHSGTGFALSIHAV